MKRPELSDADAAVLALAEHCAYSPGQRASLRRNQGITLAEARNIGWFRHVIAQLHREARKENRRVPPDEIIFLTATLLADDRTFLDAVAKHGELPLAPRNLGTSLDEVEKVQDPEAWAKKMQLKSDPQRRESRFERRLRMLLDAELAWDGTGELPFRLRQCVRLVLSTRDGTCRIAWSQLLFDLWRWNWPSRPVRREWAQAFYGDPRAMNATTEPHPEAELATDIQT